MAVFLLVNYYPMEKTMNKAFMTKEQSTLTHTYFISPKFAEERKSSTSLMLQ